MHNMRFSVSFATLASILFASFIQASSLEYLLHKHTTDVCGCVNEDLIVDVTTTNGSDHRKRTEQRNAGHINQCICVSDVESFCDNNEVAKSCINWIGRSQTRSKVESLVRNCQGSRTCSYPAHYQKNCSSSNVCGFTCTDGFSIEYKNGETSDCVCQYPKTLCGGVCGNHQSCQTQAVMASKRDEVYWGKRTQMNCLSGWTACGIPGGSARDWECVDTQNDLESCGGCMANLNLLSSRFIATGVDCTAIPGVSDVKCAAGACEVKKCRSGYSISFNGESCDND